MAACWLPDDYEATLTIAGTGRVSIEFDGKIANTDWYQKFHSASPGSPAYQRTEQEVRRYLDEMAAKDKGATFKKITHLGNGVLDVTFRAYADIPADVPTGQLAVHDMLGISYDRDQVSLDSVDTGIATADLRKAGLTSQGKVCVKTDLQVIEHNAQSTPSLFNRCYQWVVNPFNKQPLHLVVKIPRPGATAQASLTAKPFQPAETQKIQNPPKAESAGEKAAGIQYKPLSGRPTVITSAVLNIDGSVARLKWVLSSGVAEADAAFRSYVGSLGDVDCLPLSEGDWSCHARSTGVDLAEVALLSGFAKAAPTAPAHLIDAERAAKTARRGIWAY